LGLLVSKDLRDQREIREIQEFLGLLVQLEPQVHRDHRALGYRVQRATLDRLEHKVHRVLVFSSVHRYRG